MDFGFATSAAASPETLLIGVVALSIAGMGLLAWFSRPATSSRRRARPSAPPAAGISDFDRRALELDREAAAILKLVQSYIEAGQKYSVSLAEADKSLPKIATPEEMGIIVKFLISENAKMQCEAKDLRERLEQSQSQIESLCSNLAEAQETGLKDALTSLSNRRGFDASLAREIAEARRLGAALCLVMVDLDNFKKVNDDFGHLVGDEILKMFAAALRDNVGGRDSVARYGGEEFAIILPGTELEDAKGLTERVRSQLEAKELVVNDSGREIGRITASFGIAQLRDGDDAAALIERADVKLYEAKCAGRNRVAADPIAA
jgi:diguanylate cyclase